MLQKTDSINLEKQTNRQTDGGQKNSFDPVHLFRLKDFYRRLALLLIQLSTVDDGDEDGWKVFVCEKANIRKKI